MSQLVNETRRRRQAAGAVQSFEDRGIRIDFHHKHLRCLRLRVPKGPDPRTWEVALQNYFGTGNTNFAVLQWIHVPNLVQLGRRDMDLFDKITETGKQRPIDPFSIRAIHLQIDSEYAESDEERETAQEAFEQEERERKSVYLSFVAHLVRECSIKMGDHSMINADSNTIKEALMERDGSITQLDDNALTQKVAKYMATTYKIPQKQLTERVEKLARMLSPFGSINTDEEEREDGFLWREFKRLKDFHHELADLEESGHCGFRDTAAVILFATKEYVDLITARLQAAEQKLSNFAVLLSEYEKSVQFFKKIRRDVVFALDGWTMLIDFWEKAKEAPEDTPERETAMREALASILEWLPMLPPQEIRGDDERKAIWKQYDVIRTNVVKMMHSWFDDEPDYEMIDRVETAKQRQVARKPDTKTWDESALCDD